MGNTRPDYIVKTVKKMEGKDKWTHIGVAYISTHGVVTVFLSALPLNDKMILIPVRR
jgi:hypothetical protein